MKEPLDKFGAFIIRNLHDRVVDDASTLLRGELQSPTTQALQEKLAELTPEQKEVVRQLAQRLAVTATHDLLFAFQEDGSVRLSVDGSDVASLSDGLHGEIFSPQGWIARFSSASKKEANQAPQPTPRSGVAEP